MRYIKCIAAFTVAFNSTFWRSLVKASITEPEMYVVADAEARAKLARSLDSNPNREQ